MATPMKNGLDTKAIQRITQAFSSLSPEFPCQSFQKKAEAGIRGLALRQRVDFLTDLLSTCLPEDFSAAAEQLKHIPDHWDPGDEADPLRKFAAWPMIDYAARFGLNEPEISLALLKRLTALFTAEFAIRPFLIKHTQITLAELSAWCNDPSPHVRRLVSEGTRPRLPWGQRLPLFIEDPSPILALLEHLKDDPSDTVRRSVANNLNDIAKDHPEVVIQRCTDWKADASHHREKIIQHATRTLVKQGHPSVFKLLGFTENPKILIQELSLNTEKILIGDSIHFSFELVSTKNQNQYFVVDYAVHYVKANGKTNPKIFKLKNVTLAASGQLPIKKTHPFRPVTTRKLYPGEHIIEILVNGQPMAQHSFMLLETP